MLGSRCVTILGLGLVLALTACDDSGDDKDGEVTTADGTGDTEDAQPCAPRPKYPEVYSSCAGAAHCGVSGYACASQTGQDPEFNPAYCTHSCMMDSECPTIPECSAVSTCHRPGGGLGVCALECADGKECPENMMCLPDVTDGVTYYLCF